MFGPEYLDLIGTSTVALGGPQIQLQNCKAYRVYAKAKNSIYSYSFRGSSMPDIHIYIYMAIYPEGPSTQIGNRAPKQLIVAVVGAYDLHANCTLSLSLSIYIYRV